MKIIFMGTPDFAETILGELYKAKHEIVLVVTQPDKPRGRSMKLIPSSVKTWALNHNIKVYQPNRIRDEESYKYLSQFGADICVVAAYGQILPNKILDMPHYGCINVHASLLPKYRGASPIQWAILNGDDVSGVTIMKMGEGLDDGDIILQKEVSLNHTETGGELFETLSKLGADALLNALDIIADGRAVYTPQDESKASHVSMIDKSMGLLKWDQTSDVIERSIRALNPWPCAYTYLHNKTLKIWSCHILSDNDIESLNISYDEYDCGQVCYVSKDMLLIKTKDNIISLDEIQLEGKKRMDISAFLNGNNISLGERLG